MPAPIDRAADSWDTVRPALARSLTDARMQAHHAAQLVSAAGISFLEPASDDSHTSMHWSGERHGLSLQLDDGVSVTLRLAALTVSIERRGEAMAEFSLDGRTIAEGAQWVRDALGRVGLDATRYTTRRHFELPPHPVAEGRAFAASNHVAFGGLAHWYAMAAAALSETAREHGGSTVACWPHHFDIATLITVSPGRTTGAGMSPGDGYYDEPYFYVNVHPTPPPAELAHHPLAGGGAWHTHEWIGAVLRGSTLAAAAAAQREQVRRFLRSATGHTLGMLRR